MNGRVIVSRERELKRNSEMDALSAQITATCPSVYNSGSGQFFLGALTALISTHCAILDNSWPKDRAQDIIRRAADDIQYDFIIVGAGTAGSLVASRLGDLFPNWSILLIEAGDDPGVDTEIPAFMYETHHTKVDWSYETNPDGNTCLGSRNKSCIWNKGKTIGGSGAINAMLYTRGHPTDYDSWDRYDNHGWRYNNLLPYFDQLERKLVTDEGDDNPIYNIINEAWKDLGFKFENYKNEAHIGTMIAKQLISHGKRLNTAKLFLRESKKVHVLKNTIVQKIIIDSGTKTAVGVEARHVSGVVMQIKASKETILSAGSIGTPQILMLSGIGPKSHLQDHNIENIADLPVGQNLQDHLMFPIFLNANQNISIPMSSYVSFLLQYMLTKSGPLAKLGIINFFGFINTNDTSEQPDIQYHNIHFPKNDQVKVPKYLRSVGYTDEIVNSILDLNKDSDLFVAFPTLLHPASKGEVLLANTDPASKPLIKPNYLENIKDVKILLRAIRFVNKLEKTKTYKSHGVKVLELKIAGCSDFDFNTDEYWECYIRHLGITVYHPVGTAKMGVDKDSVVDYDLKVHSLKKLRVVDASIMPKIPGGNTMAPTLALGAKAVDLIAKKHAVVYRDEF